MAIEFKDRPLDYANGRRINSEEWNAISRTAETDELAFGVPVKAGAGRHTCAIITGAGEDVIGITETNQVLPHPGDHYNKHETAAICESGVIGVIVSGAVAAGDQATWNPSTGKWSSGAASGTNIVIPGAFYEHAGTDDGEVVPIRYRRQPGELTDDGV